MSVDILIIITQSNATDISIANSVAFNSTMPTIHYISNSLLKSNGISTPQNILPPTEFSFSSLFDTADENDENEHEDEQKKPISKKKKSSKTKNNEDDWDDEELEQEHHDELDSATVVKGKGKKGSRS